MSQYHLNNIPDDLMEHIRLRAAKRRGTMRDYLLDLVRDDRHDYFTNMLVLPEHAINLSAIQDSDIYTAVDHGTHITIRKDEA